MLVKLAVIVQVHSTSFPHVFVQSLNACVYCSVCSFGIAVTVVDQIVNGFELAEMLVPYGTVTDHVLTVHEFILLEIMVTSYSFTVLLNSAVYVASHVTLSIAGFHHENV